MTASGPRNGTRTVLVVEDEPAIRGLLSLTLEARATMWPPLRTDTKR